MGWAFKAHQKLVLDDEIRSLDWLSSRKQFFGHFEKIKMTANQMNEFRRPTQIFDEL